MAGPLAGRAPGDIEGNIDGRLNGGVQCQGINHGIWKLVQFCQDIDR